MSIESLNELDGLIEPSLRAARIPGAALAVVIDGETVFAKGYGYRDLEGKLPALPTGGEVTLSYHENSRRELELTQRLSAKATAPSGGAVHSTVRDMTRWLAFNLNGGAVAGTQLIQPQTLTELHTPQMLLSPEALALTGSSSGAYAMGWRVDMYNGHARVLHVGGLHDVDSCVMLFPGKGVGIVSFTNFGGPGFAPLINQYAFDRLMGLDSPQKLEDQLGSYEKMVKETARRNAAVHRVANTSLSHPPWDYAGRYRHAGYGDIDIDVSSDELILHRGDLHFPLQHWHYEAWIAREPKGFAIHLPHAFDPASRLLFEMNADGEIAALTIQLEPAVAPIRFRKQTESAR